MNVATAHRSTHGWVAGLVLLVCGCASVAEEVSSRVVAKPGEGGFRGRSRSGHKVR